ncbi:hypothetical protein EW145_g5470 [Phellinidium pouzarii]|uniref:Protein kinase domain-containing protein n=1 Tax=Phellinidium pouzarii TaxID=167371 RepID=A0A4S4L179_9AGAM|nr:hypothetical protein EW145_g5470 [Phellinidium pouzarii]
MSSRLPPASVAAVSTDTDIFSITDAHLAERLRFIREIGAGNWGCVWLCAPKTNETRTDSTNANVAVKLVFREKKPTTAQRVRSLWNEMKIVRALKQDPHPSIVPFHSFIITPSFAIITMEYLPHLVPVEVPEPKAREWFRSLLSAVSFLHGRGVVHNDIKPANILLSTKKVPVLVDFGFAERYEPNAKRAFLSNLAYGTPEYLSPERARGNVHDTRRSDMWSLGITFFEILIGRTPFEYVEGEKFTTPEDLERYWLRTVKGKWVGEWKMSKSAERFLRRLIAPNVEIRCTALEAMEDKYWAIETAVEISKNMLDVISSPPPPAKTPSRVKKTDSKSLMTPNKENIERVTPERPASANEKRTRVAARPNRHVHQHILPPIEGSPRTPRTAARHKLPISAAHNSPRATPAPKPRAPVTRKPVPLYVDDENKSPIKPKNMGTRSSEIKERNRRSRVLVDSTSRIRNVETPKRGPVVRANEKVKQADSVKTLGSGSYDRVKAFERLKQLERSRFLEEEDQEEEERGDKQEPILLRKPSSQYMHVVLSASGFSTESAAKTVMDMSFERQKAADSSFTLASDFKGNLGHRSSQDERPVEGNGLYGRSFQTPSPVEMCARSNTTDSSLTLFKQSIRVSVEKSLRLYKSSTLGRTSVRKASRRASEELTSKSKVIHRDSWYKDSFVHDAKTSLPVGRPVLRNEQINAESKVDRLSLWVRNVEQVVKEAKENFASSSVTPLPPLPVRRASRPAVPRASRAPRKILAADQIFQTGVSESILPACETTNKTSEGSSTVVVSIPAKEASPVSPASPSRARRATISASPGLKTTLTDNIDVSPSRRKEKAKSSGNLNLVRPISPLYQLQKELERDEDNSIPNLSKVLDRSIFVARTMSTPHLDDVFQVLATPSSPRTVAVARDPITRPLSPPKSPPPSNVLRESSSSPVLNSPNRRHIEGVYDRLLMAATGVKRVGRGYQSDVSVPAQQCVPVSMQKKNSKLFGRSVRAVHPPVSYDNPGKSGDAEEFGLMSVSYSTSFRDDANKSVNAVRKAFKAIVTGKSVARRQSKAVKI